MSLWAQSSSDLQQVCPLSFEPGKKTKEAEQSSFLRVKCNYFLKQNTEGVRHIYLQTYIDRFIKMYDAHIPPFSDLFR